MKKIIVIMLLITTVSIAQKKAKVHTVNGVEVYLLAEPVRSYEIVNTGKNGIKWGSYITGGLINQSISTKVSKFIKRLNKDMLEKGIVFDAVMYTSGKEMSAIKFTDDATTQNKGIATVHKINGIPFYVMNEPVNGYDFITNIGKGIKWKSLVTAGIWNNSIEEDLLKFASKMERKFKKKKIDAIIYSNGKKAIAVKF